MKSLFFFKSPSTAPIPQLKMSQIPLLKPGMKVSAKWMARKGGKDYFNATVTRFICFHCIKSRHFFSLTHMLPLSYSLRLFLFFLFFFWIILLASPLSSTNDGCISVIYDDDGTSEDVLCRHIRILDEGLAVRKKTLIFLFTITQT